MSMPELSTEALRLRKLWSTPVKAKCPFISLQRIMHGNERNTDNACPRSAKRFKAGEELPSTLASLHSTKYTHIRFIGYVIPTTPANIVAVGDPNGQGAVAGTYLGHENVQKDIQGRLSVLQVAVKTAKAQLPSNDVNGTVLTVFCAPEFFWHGHEGPYLHTSKAEDPADVILQALADAFPANEYPHWLFICGTAITARVENKEKLYNLNSTITRNAVVESLCRQLRHCYGPLSEVIMDMLVGFIKHCHAYPLLSVRNRALILGSNLHDVPNQELATKTMTTEKYFCSNEDFLLYEVNKQPVVTEQMVTYQSIDLTAGDVKRHTRDKYAIFQVSPSPLGSAPDSFIQSKDKSKQPPPVESGIPMTASWREGPSVGAERALDVAVEICLDHRDVRLRRNIGNHPFHVQLIPSCGMQIKENGAAVEEGGLIFNVDGQYAIGGTSTSASGLPQRGKINEVPCLFTNYVDETNEGYAGHTQLARVQRRAVGVHVSAKGSRNASFYENLGTDDVRVFPVKAVHNLASFFAGGPGALHIYGFHKPLPLYTD